MVDKFQGSFTQQVPISEEAIDAAISFSFMACLALGVLKTKMANNRGEFLCLPSRTFTLCIIRETVSGTSAQHAADHRGQLVLMNC